MTGTHTQNPVYSRITLALMEDTGWYKANYSMAQTLNWGKNLGCEFVKKSCKDWMDKNRALWVLTMLISNSRFHFHLNSYGNLNASSDKSNWSLVEAGIFFFLILHKIMWKSKIFQFLTVTVTFIENAELVNDDDDVWEGRLFYPDYFFISRR